MTNLTRSNFQAHPFHLVSPSPWPLFTCIALFTLTTAGEYFIMPALNQTICWNILYFEILGRSAGNLLAFDFLGILRDYTLELFCCITPVNNSGKINFSHYLAGLIEGDGTIIVPKKERSSKGRLYYPYMQIIFDSRYLPLALIIQKTLSNILFFICILNDSILLAFVPAVVYANADTQNKSAIVHNIGKSGVCCWKNTLNGNLCIGFSVDLGRRFRQYYNAYRLLTGLEKKKTYQ